MVGEFVVTMLVLYYITFPIKSLYFGCIYALILCICIFQSDSGLAHYGPLILVI